MTVMAAIVVANGDQRIRFEGKQLSRASSEFGYRGEHKSRWTEITIYRTNDGKYVVSKIGKSRVVHLSYDCPPARCCWSTTSSRAPSRPWTRPPLRSWWCLSLPRRVVSAGDTCQPWATGRVWRTAHQNRADDQRLAVVSGAALSLLIIELVPGSNSC